MGQKSGTITYLTYELVRVVHGMDTTTLVLASMLTVVPGWLCLVVLATRSIIGADQLELVV